MAKTPHIDHPAVHAFWAYWQAHCPTLGKAHRHWLENCIEVLPRVKRGERLFTTGQRPDYLYFVVEGLLANVLWDEDGRRRIPALAPAGHNLLTCANLYTHTQINGEIVALRRSTALRIPAVKLRNYKDSDVAASTLVHVLREKRIKQFRKQNALLMLADEKQRYRAFATVFPEFLRHTTQAEQADYLNISRTSITRVRRER